MWKKKYASFFHPYVYLYVYIFNFNNTIVLCVKRSSLVECMACCSDVRICLEIKSKSFRYIQHRKKLKFNFYELKNH